MSGRRPPGAGITDNYDGVVDYGLVEDKFEWSQDKDTVYVTVHDLPAGTRGRDIDIEMKRDYLRVGIKGQEPFIDGKLRHMISLDDSMWGLDTDDMKLELTLVKHVPQPEEWWPSLLVGGREIMTELIEGSKFLDKSLLRKVRAAKEAEKKAEEAGKATE